MTSSQTAPRVDQGKACPAPGAPGWRGSGRVLVVDDDVAIAIVLSRALSRIGFTAALAGDGTEALQKFGADPAPFVLAIVDYKLPGMPSEEVLRGLRAQRPDLPLIVTSGYDRAVAMSKADGLRVNGFLHKPFSVDSLASEVRAALSA